MTRVDVLPAPRAKAEEGDASEVLHTTPSPQDSSPRRTSKSVGKDNGQESQNIPLNDLQLTTKRSGQHDDAEVGSKSRTSPKKDNNKETKDSALDIHSTAHDKDSANVEMDGDPPLSSSSSTSSPQQTIFMCNKFHYRLLFFLLLVGLDLADLFSDWLLYADVRVAQKGLVYGPPEKSVINALLAFSIVGTFTFLFEVANLWREMFGENPWLNVDLVSMLTIWLEDLPQIVINFYIAMCREDPISVFQLSKASVVLIALLVRIIISFVRYCSKAALNEAHQKTPSSRRHVAYRVFIMLGLLINSGFAAAVFVFTQTQRDADGGLVFQVPETIFDEQYNDQRYFQNVSVFIHHPDFDVTLPNSSSNFKASWVRFMSINDIRDRSDLDISYNYIYENTATHLNMALFVKEVKTGNGHSGAWRLSECYKMELGSRQIASVDKVTCQTSFFSPRATSVFITFSFIPPSHIFRKLIFGDICFNVKTYEHGTCQEYDTFAEAVSANATIPSIHYYRTNATLAPADMRHLLVEGGVPRFYRSDGHDLEDITEVWKTGWWRCESSGSMAPHFRDSIPVDCSATVPPVAAG